MGKASMDGLRGLVAEIDGAERGLLVTRTADQGNAFVQGFSVSIGGAIASLIVAIALGLALASLIARPVGAMTEAVRELSAGNKRLTIPGLGRSDEIGAMASAVEVFAKNAIEADRLTEVQRVEDQAKLARMDSLNRLIGDFKGKVGTVVTTVSSAAKQLQHNA